MNALELRGVSGGYGDTTVLRDVDLEVGAGQVVALLGPNGAGKSTLLKIVSGLLRPSRGTVVLHGEDVTQLACHQVARRGVCHVPEGRGIYPSLTVRENLELHTTRSLSSEACQRVFDLFPVLAKRVGQVAGTMSGGEQQMLALSRAFVANPKLVLVDELSMGLAPIITHELFNKLADLARSGVSMLVVEQYATQVLALADRAYVLRNGQIRFSGDASGIDMETVMREYTSGSAVVSPEEPDVVERVLGAAHRPADA